MTVSGGQRTTALQESVSGCSYYQLGTNPSPFVLSLAFRLALVFRLLISRNKMFPEKCGILVKTGVLVKPNITSCHTEMQTSQQLQ